MNLEDLQAKLHQMGSAEASALGQALETIWWDESDDVKAQELAIAYMREIQGWAKRVEEVLTGVRKEL
ncbi:MAG TPA: hypothetical protein VIJ87_08340 [Pyrinomonadaceae bacterium]|jgi:hypothetical protein